MSRHTTMNYHLRNILCFLLMGGAFTLVGCAKGTYLEINFTGATLAPIYVIALNLTLNGPDGGVQKPKECLGGYCTITARQSKDPIVLPTSSALKLDGEVGTLIIEAAALSAVPAPNVPRTVVGTAPPQTTVIMPDETWTIDINFVPATTP